MKHPSQEDLLGYVLGALDAQEERELQEQIDANPDIEEQLLQIRNAMAPMDSLDFGEPGSRPGLARRTCELVASLQHRKQDLFEDSDAIREMFDDSPAIESALSATENRKPGFALARISDRLIHPGSLSRIDMLAGVAILAVFLSVLFPAISHSRFNGRIVACKHNLTNVGNAMLRYSDLHCGKFMDIAGLEFDSANTGLFAPVLKSTGFVESDNAFACAGRSDCEPPRIPTIQQVLNAKGSSQFELLKRRMGGHFGYAMGFIEGQRHFAPRNDGASHTLLIADMPSVDMPGRSSSNHAGKGQNCFFADGRVQFVPSHSIGNDAIYENDLGIVSPGIGSHDNVIAPCHVPAVKVTVLDK